MKTRFLYACIVAVFITACGRQSSTEENQDVTKARAIDAVPIKFIKKRIEGDTATTGNAVPRSQQLHTSCIIEGVFFDECPLGNSDEVSPGGGGGNGDNTLPDFNPISGSIIVTNPAIVGQPFTFSVVIANAGGNNIPPTSLETLPDVPFDGVRVNFHILTPENPQPGEDNLVFVGLFDPTTLEDGASYLLSSSFNLASFMVQPGANHQFAVVVDPDNSIVESNDNNNTSFDQETFTLIGNTPDLLPVTGEGNVTLAPNPVQNGEELTVGCKVKNIGSPLNGSANVRVKYTASLTKGDKLANPITLGFGTLFLSQNEKIQTNQVTGIIRKDVIITLAPGEYTVKAEVNPNNTIAEVAGGITNNTAVLGTLRILPAGVTPAGQPNLIVHYTGITVPAFEPTNIFQTVSKLKCRVMVENNGTAAARGPITLRLSTDSIVLTLFGRTTSLKGPHAILKTVTTGGLRPGDTRMIEVEVDVFGFRDATGKPYDLQAYGQQVTWTVDPKNKINEIDDTDNSVTLANAFSILAPDLDVPRGGKGTSKIINFGIVGRKTLFTYPIVNTGNAPVKNFNCLYELRDSTGRLVATEDVLYGNGSTMSNEFINPGAKDSLRVLINGAFPGKGYKLDVFIDFNQVVDEHFVKHLLFGGTEYRGGEDNDFNTVVIIPR